ncbi:winged helix DNA-binding domain-containing protein [Actinokineospora soli]
MALSLNRATLTRQHLITRAALDPLTCVEHLVGMQSQNPEPPYTGLWSRLVDFTPDQLSTLIADRTLVRLLLMRGTIHLVSARDAHGLRTLVQPVLDRGFASILTIPKSELPAILDAATEHLTDTALTAVELAALLGPRFPHHDPMALATAARAHLPLVQVPPRGLWGKKGPAAHTLATTWIGPPTTPAPTLDDLVLRYLAAFGPATPADAQAWSGLTGLRELFDRLGLWHTEHDGRTHFDLPDAPRPHPDTPAPARYLTGFDNLLLSPADGTRVITDDHRRAVITKNGIVHPTILIDGHVAGTWRTTTARARTTLTVTPFAPLTRADRDALTAEGHALLAALAPDTSHDVQV